MRYMLDTNICIYIIKRQPPQVLRRAGDLGTRQCGDVGGELRRTVRRAGDSIGAP
jgi:predicted nucleic acid-binding protein